GPFLDGAQTLVQAQALVTPGAEYRQKRAATREELLGFFAGVVAAVRAVEQRVGTGTEEVRVAFPVLGAGLYRWDELVALQVLLAAVDSVRTSKKMRVVVVFYDKDASATDDPVRVVAEEDGEQRVETDPGRQAELDRLRRLVKTARENNATVDGLLDA